MNDSTIPASTAPPTVRTELARENFKSTLLALLSGLSIFTGVTLGILLNWHYQPRYKVIDPDTHEAKVLGSDAFIVSRSFEVTKDTEFHMSRELVKEENGVVTRVELPDVTVFYRRDVHRVDRVQPLLSVPPGKYKYLNHLCWEANVLRTECIDLPVLDLEVPAPSPEAP